MSQIFVAYNRKPLSEKEKNNISTRLYVDLFTNKEPGLNDFVELASYKQFGKIQLIYPQADSLKFKMYSDSRYLMNICGVLHNEIELLLKEKEKDVFKYLIKLYQGGERKLFNFFLKTTGQFVVFIYDKKKDKIILSNDKLGLYSAYYYENKNQFLYSTSAEVITAIPETKQIVNYDAIADYLSLGIVQNRESFLQNINNLQEGSSLVKEKNKKLQIKQYYKSKYDDSSYSRKKYLPLVNHTLTNVIKDMHHGFSGRKMSCMTGGFDTRLMNSILHKNNKKRTIIFTRSPIKEESEINKFAIPMDEKIGRAYAKKFGLKYFLFDNSKKEAGKERNDLILMNGLFGGEMLGAESYNQPATLFRVKIPTIGKTHFLSKRFQNLLSRDPIETYYRNINKIESDDFDKKIFIHKAMLLATSFFNNLENYGGQDWQHPHRIFYKNGFLDAKIVLYPYLDSDFLELIFKIPFQELDNHIFYKALLEKYYSKYLKVDILHGKKRYYKYNKETKKLYLYRKIEEEIMLKKGIDSIDEKKRRENGVRDFMNFINNPVSLDSFERGLFFHKAVEVNEKDLLFHRIENLQEWFKRFM